MKDKAIPNHRLRQARELQGWSQQEVAARIDAPGSYYISRWERGITFPSPLYRERLCTLFGMNAQDLGLLPPSHVPAPPVDSDDFAASPEPATPLWSVPFLRNPFFIGRDDVLAQVHAYLFPPQPTTHARSLALHGLGGVGKTQLAVEYAYRFADTYRALFWIDAETVESIQASVLQVAEVLALPEWQQADQARMIAAVQRWLATHPDWLMIWDNVDDPAPLIRFFPPCRHGAVLITTQHQTLGTLAVGLELPPLPSEDGLLLLRRRAYLLDVEASREQVQHWARHAPEEYQQSKHLVELMGGLPLALDQVGAYLEETSCSLSDYLHLFQTHRAALLSRRGTALSNHPEPVTTTVSLAFERVAQTNAAAADLLRLAALLAPEPIPENVIVAGAPHLGPTLEPVVADPYQFDLALAALRGASLITIHPERKTLSVHRLVQAVLRDLLAPEEIDRWRERIARMLHATFPPVQPETWPQCEQSVTQVLACFPWLKQMGSRFPEIGELCYQAGSYLLERRRMEEAAPLLEQAVILEEQSPREDARVLLERLEKQAELFWVQSQYEQAEHLLQRVLRLEEQALGKSHPRTAETLSNLGLLYWSQGKYEQAEPLYLQALHHLERDSGESHPQTATTLNNLGLLYYNQGKYEQAEPLYLQALRHRERELGASHPQTANILNNLGALYSHQKKYEQAEPLLKRALAIREQQLGPEHPATATTLHNLATISREQGNLAQAGSLLLRSLAIKEQQLGPEHPDTAFVLHSLAIVRQAQGKHAEAQSLFEQALQIRTRALGPAHPHTRETRQYLSALLQAIGKAEAR
ncbi:MAG: helix-turn-helix transcriptional regulator [Ktedonobacteraceae bacterium]|nr:helix-turn-helix transcriptional regulator [Ktedonobacteraceae bacterium]